MFLAHELMIDFTIDKEWDKEFWGNIMMSGDVTIFSRKEHKIIIDDDGKPDIINKLIVLNGNDFFYVFDFGEKEVKNNGKIQT